MEASDVAVLRQRVQRLESDVALNSGRLDAVVRLEERVVGVQEDLRGLSATVKELALARDREHEEEARLLRERRRQEQEDRKSDRRALWGIAGTLFVAIVVFILGIAQAGILH